MNALIQTLTREGVLISVSIRYWRAHKKLRPEDIGLTSDKVSARLISLGHKRLLPKEATAALALVESRAHSVVEAIMMLVVSMVPQHLLVMGRNTHLLKLGIGAGL